MSRRPRKSTLAVPLAVAAATAAGLLASPAAGQSLEDDLRTLRERFEALEAENARMSHEIDELRAAQDPAWLNEQRADEIRSLVADVLADADTRRSTNLDSGFMAGWSDHFFLASPDGRFKLAIDGQLQFRYVFNRRERFDRVRDGFEFTRARLTLRGHVFGDKLSFLVRTDPTRNEPGLVTGLYYLRDAWIQYQFNDNWAIRVGQMKVPYNREELVSSAYQQAVERSQINEAMNAGRTQGIELRWAGETSKFYFQFNEGTADSLGGFNLAGGLQPVNTSALQPGVEYAFAARWEELLAGEWRQFQDITSPPDDPFGVMIGVAGFVQEAESIGSGAPRRDEERWYGAAVDLSIEYGGANLFAQGLWSYVDNGGFGLINVYGITVQGGFYTTAKTELFTRFEYGWWNLGSAAFADLNLLTVGMNYYLDGHDAKLSFDLGAAFSIVDQNWLPESSEDNSLTGFRRDFRGQEGQYVFRAQFQLLF